MNDHSLGSAPIEQAYRDKMTAVAQGLDEIFNGQVGGPGRKVGFILLVFPFGAREGRCNYISNGANRDDVVTLLKEQLAYFQGAPETKGGTA
jgi:hypothetical protein